MKKGINKVSIILLIALVFFTSIVIGCNVGTPVNKKAECDTEINNKHLKMLDTTYVYGIHAMFVFAQDTLDKDLSGIGKKVDIVKIKNGMLVIKNNPVGIRRYLDDNNIGSIYFRNNQDKIELYYKIGIGISNSLQTILNMAVLRDKPFNRKELDSFFRYYIYGIEANVDFTGDFIKLYDTLPPRVELVDKSFERIKRGISKKCDSNNFHYLVDFYNFLKQNEGKDNFFFYRGNSGTSSSGYFLVTVNEEFKSDSLARKFYENYAPQVGFMYTIKCYFPYYIIEEGEY